jgi:hypothetical protein
MFQTQFFPEFPPESDFARFAGFQPSARSDPKTFPTFRQLNPHEKNFQFRGEKNGSDRLPLNTSAHQRNFVHI